MKKISLLSLCVVLIGCQTSPQSPPRVSPPLIKVPATAADLAAWPQPKDVEEMTDAIEKIRKQRGATNTGVTLAIPSRRIRASIPAICPVPDQPPALPPIPQPRSRLIKALSVEEPDKYIVVRWDADPDPTVSYVLQWQAHGSNVFCGVPITQSKVDLVGLFKSQQLPAGQYQIQVLAINELFVISDPVSAVTLFWKP